MALQELKVWAKEKIIDSVTEIAQRRDISTEEFENGWKRLSTVSAQQANGLFYLLTSYASPFSNSIYLMSSSVATPSTALELDGSTFTEEDYPNLYEIYAGTLPNLSAEAPTGCKYIIRAN